MHLLWVLANNRKTGKIPAAYVGTTPKEARDSCKGCPLLESKKCYSWSGMNSMIFRGQHSPRFAYDPGHFALDSVFKSLGRQGAKFVAAARIGVLGDPVRAFRHELKAAIATIRSRALAVLGYTHFWREPGAQELSGDLMASCDDLAQADEAAKAGWRPAVIVSADHQGVRFTTPGGLRGVVCPAQTHDKVTCNTCKLCDPQHKAWTSGKLQAIGFLDHSRKAVNTERRNALDPTLPLFKPREPLSGWRDKGKATAPKYSETPAT